MVRINLWWYGLLLIPLTLQGCFDCRSAASVNFDWTSWGCFGCFCCDGRLSVLGMWFTEEWACVFVGGDDGGYGVVDVDSVAD